MLYGIILRLRHLAYDKGWKKSAQAPVPTICVGNVTAGGTGKTPHTEMILRTLIHSDEWAFKPLGMLSRGYKRKSKGYQVVPMDGSAALYGDEPVQIARKFPAVAVAVDKDRLEGCRKLAEAGSALIVLDDAFQYRRLRASKNIVLVDYYRPVFKDKLLPWGRLRDLPSRLKKADMVIVTKCPGEVDDAERAQWRKDLKLRGEQPLFFTSLRYGAPVPVFPEGDTRYAYSQRLILFTGIANDAPLRSYLSDSYKIVQRLEFPDHHKYTRADVRKLSAAVKANPTACLMTTEKDAQRIADAFSRPSAGHSRPSSGHSRPDRESLRQRMFYLPVEAAFLSPEEEQAFTDALMAGL
ncbi:MAG: tetraacyldisaccharide 4'-kinase [Bacteroidales bacterium]|nr:tetraacyldisaccharide 4'-kinase [Bacteroidales bacterium]